MVCPYGSPTQLFIDVQLKPNSCNDNKLNWLSIRSVFEQFLNSSGELFLFIGLAHNNI